MRSKHGSAFQGRPSLWADDHLRPGERERYGDDLAREVAHARHLAAVARYRAADIDPETDLADERPEGTGDPETAVEVTAWRRAMLAGHPLAFRGECM